MATWHQEQARTRLWHETKWTVVEDPPNQCRSLTLCDTEQEAITYRDARKARGATHVYILKPAQRAGER